jgi:hypothetical protein
MTLGLRVDLFAGTSPISEKIFMSSLSSNFDTGIVSVRKELYSETVILEYRVEWLSNVLILICQISNILGFKVIVFIFRRVWSFSYLYI